MLHLLKKIMTKKKNSLNVFTRSQLLSYIVFKLLQLFIQPQIFVYCINTFVSSLHYRFLSSSVHMASISMIRSHYLLTKQLCSFAVCRRVIHTVGPKYAVKYHTAAENALSHCYRSCLELLIENELRRWCNITPSCLFSLRILLEFRRFLD